jgi:hypothetical protein
MTIQALKACIAYPKPALARAPAGFQKKLPSPERGPALSNGPMYPQPPVGEAHLEHERGHAEGRPALCERRQCVRRAARELLQQRLRLASRETPGPRLHLQAPHHQLTHHAVARRAAGGGGDRRDVVPLCIRPSQLVKL